MELRYYDIPQNEFLIALQNQNWQNKYQTEEDGLHFHNLLEIGLCVQGYGIMRLEEENVHFETGMLSIIPQISRTARCRRHRKEIHGLTYL